MKEKAQKLKNYQLHQTPIKLFSWSPSKEHILYLNDIWKIQRQMNEPHAEEVVKK